MVVLEADWLITDAAASPLRDAAVAVSDDRIADVGTVEELRARHPQAERIALGDALLMPGLVNAHQHGRGLSQIQLGYRDDELEPWIARRRGRAAPDAYVLTRLAALEMLANGVTATLHANYSYASGDYEAELRGSIRAYEETGIRATVCVGYADRGGLVYPPNDEAMFRAGLSDQARAHLDGARPAYLPLAQTMGLMARLLDEYAGHPTITFAYGPAGPQWVSDEAWRALSRDAATRGVGLHFHLLESPAQARAAAGLYPAGTLAALEGFGVFDMPASAAHFVHTGPADIEDAARLGLVVVTNPGSNMRLHNGAPRLAAFERAGIRVALGTDNCALADDEDYLRELRLGGLLARAPAQNAKDRAARLLEMATASGAAAAFLNDTGRIAPGMKADLVAVDLARVRGAYLDPDAQLLDAVMARASGRDVVLTMVDGRVLYRDGDITNASIDEARAAAHREALAHRSAGEGAMAAAGEIAEALRAHYAGAAR